MFSWRRYTGSRIVELGGQWREAIPPPSNLFCPTLPLRHSLLIHFSSPTNSSALTLRDEDLNLVIEGPADMFSWRRYTGSRIVELGSQWREAIPTPSNLFCPKTPLFPLL